MRFAYEWIREYAPTRCRPEEVARRLTAAGLSVERLDQEDGEHFFDIDVTTNRPDCMNLYGICRETAVQTRGRLRPVRPRIRETGPPIRNHAGLEVRDGELCPRYSARLLFGIRVGPSPAWMQKRLTAMGLRPINLIVDATNYVLMELGQPLHAFDLDLLEDRRIVVRRARRGETLVTLDGIERKLTPDMLVIADARRPVALAGVMGGQDTEIRASTRNVLLESAWFDPQSVRRTARRLGLHTEASHRFERGADIGITRLALDRCCELLLESGHGEVARGYLDFYPRKHKPRRIRVSAERTSSLLGDKVGTPEMGRWLRALGFSVSGTGAGNLAALVPTYRSDIDEEVDLIEEIARCRGYDRIPARLPLLPGRGAGRSRTAKWIRLTRTILSALGYQEVVNFSMVDPGLEERFAGPPHDRIALMNPLSDRASVLRRSLLPGILQNLAFNINRGLEDQKLFEVGRSFRRRGGRKLPVEDTLISIAVSGRAEPPHWIRPAGKVSLFHLKGLTEALLNRLGVGSPEYRTGDAGILDDTQHAAVVVDGSVIGTLGRLRQEIAAAAGIDSGLPVYVAELCLDRMMRLPARKIRYRQISRHPAIHRDLALVIDAGQSFAEIEKVIRDVDGDRIATVAIFDRFAGRNLPPGKVSLGVHLEYQRPDRTLLKEEVASLENRILDALGSRLGITLRSTDDHESR